MVNKENMDDLVMNVQKNVSFIATAITMYLHEDELVNVIDEKLNEIMFFINRAYNPELVELKRQSRIYYQKWLLIKTVDPNTAKSVYLEYMKLKCRIDLMEIPF